MAKMKIKYKFYALLETLIFLGISIYMYFAMPLTPDMFLNILVFILKYIVTCITILFGIFTRFLFEMDT